MSKNAVKEKMEDGSIVETVVNKTFTRVSRTLNGIFVDFPDGTPAIRKLVNGYVTDYSRYPMPDDEGRRNVTEVTLNKEGTQIRKSVFLYGSHLYKTEYIFLNSLGIETSKDIYIECGNDQSRTFESTRKYDDSRMASFKEYKNPYDHINPSKSVSYAPNGDITHEYTETWNGDVCNTLSINNGFPVTKIEREFILKDNKYFKKWAKTYEYPKYKNEEVFELKNEKHYDFAENGEHYLKNEISYRCNAKHIESDTVIKNDQKITTTIEYLNGKVYETKFEVTKKNSTYTRTTCGKSESVFYSTKNKRFERKTVDGVLKKYVKMTDDKTEEIHADANEVSQKIIRKSDTKTSTFSRKIDKNGCTSENIYVEFFKDGITYTEEHNKFYDIDGKVLSSKDSSNKIVGNKFNSPFGRFYENRLSCFNQPSIGYHSWNPFLCTGVISHQGEQALLDAENEYKVVDKSALIG